MCFLASEFDQLLRSGNLIPIVAILVGCGTGVIAILCGTISGVAKAKARESTKREIAAYVAEGSIDPDHAIAMLNAGRSSCEIKDDGITIT